MPREHETLDQNGPAFFLCLKSRLESESDSQATEDGKSSAAVWHPRRLLPPISGTARAVRFFELVRMRHRTACAVPLRMHRTACAVPLLAKPSLGVKQTGLQTVSVGCAFNPNLQYLTPSNASNLALILHPSPAEYPPIPLLATTR